MIALLGAAVLMQDAAPKPDPAAYALLEKASQARSTMPQNVAKVSGEATVNQDGKTHRLTFVYSREDGVSVEAGGAPEDVAGPLQSQLSSIYGHRRGGSFAEGDGRYPLTFTGEDGPLGRRIALNDSLKSFYRVRGDEITEVDRVMGGTRFIITIVENTRTADGKVLPKHFTVNTFGRDGSITTSETFTDTYVQVDGVWLIQSRRVLTARDSRISSWKADFDHLKITRQ